ncbi:hypothetical protein VTL71DRAFT_15432 [Oculimacula yallundae]|uniref:2EXR domain-containing protein n=1 Tax=Oculimacula yallundae TaxID=86028 RepID=A0ABR4CIV9_9HELO
MDSFPLFPLLPTELRLKIWSHTLPSTPSLLPRTSTSSHLLRTCRESRSVHSKTFSQVFLPSAREQFTHTISLYGHRRLDDTLYLDDINSITRDFKEWILPAWRGADSEGMGMGEGDGQGAGNRARIRKLAVRDEMWKQRSARASTARLEGGTGDLRFMMFHPESGLAGMEVLFIVLTGGVLSSGCRRGSGGSSSSGFGGEDGDGRDERRLVGCEEMFVEDKCVGSDVRVVLWTLRRLNYLELGHGWREPELRFARIVVD